MDIGRISDLLQPFLQGPLAPVQLTGISIYIDLMSRWNQRINLTAVRDPEAMVTRHFGESLFAAQQLFSGTSGASRSAATGARVVDVGSGAGFPGLPIKLWAPDIRLTLIESNQKKAAFLREVARTLKLPDVDVFSRRAEDFQRGTADVVTLRAVEQFESVLPTTARLAAPGGRLALLIGEAQVEKAQHALPSLTWNPPLVIPGSLSRVLAIGTPANPSS
jgi:16S rRNA (guanine527-N7)-methyltransferase